MSHSRIYGNSAIAYCTGLALASAPTSAVECVVPKYAETITVGGAGSDSASRMSTNPFGQLYIAGSYSETVDFDWTEGQDDFHTSAGGADAFLTEVQFNLLPGWTVTIGGEITDKFQGVSAFTATSVYVGGTFFYTVDFDPSSDIDERTSVGENDGFVSKYDYNGEYQWTHIIAGENNQDVNDLITDNEGNVYAAGAFSSPVDFDPSESGVDLRYDAGSYDIFVTSYDTDGNYRWTATIGGEGFDTPRDISSFSAGLMVVGDFTGTVDFDPGLGMDEHTAVGETDLFVTCLTFDGEYLWTRTVGGIDWDYSPGVAADQFDNIYLTGAFGPDGGAVDFDPGDGIDLRHPVGGSDIFVLSLTAEGDYRWTWTAGGNAWDAGADLAVDNAGHVFVTGCIADGPTPPGYVIDFDPTGTGDVRTGYGSSDAFTTMLHSDGSYGWTYLVGGTAADMGKGIAVDSTLDRIHVTGSFIGTVDFDPQGAGDVRVSNGSTDIFLLTLTCSGEIPVCDGDANADNVVDPLDSGYVLARFGCPVGSGDPLCDAADANLDGIVDPLDVGYVMSRFGECE